MATNIMENDVKLSDCKVGEKEDTFNCKVAFAEKIQEALLKKLALDLEQAMLYRWLRDFPKMARYHTFGHERKVVTIPYQYAPKRVDGDIPF